jgi:hypothetical protein
MTSKIILAIHTALFTAFAGASLGSPFVRIVYPGIFSGPYVSASIIAISIAVAGFWKIYGECPLTVLENNLRRREGRESYSGPCVDRYAREWFGLTLPSKFSTNALYILLALLIVTVLL